MKLSLKDQALSKVEHDGHREKIAEGLRLAAMYIVNGKIKEEPFIRWMESEEEWYKQELEK